MKLKHIFFSPILLLVSLHLSSSIVCGQSQSMSGSTFYGGNAYSYKISDEDLMHTPSWNPAKEEPPLSLRKAAEIARVNLRRFVKKADGLDVEKVVDAREPKAVIINSRIPISPVRLQCQGSPALMFREEP